MTMTITITTCIRLKNLQQSNDHDNNSKISYLWTSFCDFQIDFIFQRERDRDREREREREINEKLKEKEKENN